MFEPWFLFFMLRIEERVGFKDLNFSGVFLIDF